MPRNYFTQSCSGCFETVDGHVPYQDGKPIYPYDKKAGCYVGAGCHECGYTGKRRNYFNPKDFEKAFADIEAELAAETASADTQRSKKDE